MPLVFRLNSESSPLVLLVDCLQSQEKNEGTTLMYVEVRGSLKNQFSLLQFWKNHVKTPHRSFSVVVVFQMCSAKNVRFVLSGAN